MDSEEYDLGVIGPEQIAERQIVIRNAGRKALHLESISTTCKCTVGSLNSSSIPAGSEGILEVRIRGASASGLMVEEVKIRSNDPQKPTTTLAFKVLVDPILEVRPRTVDFDFVPKEELPLKRVVTILPSLGRELDANLVVLTDSDIVSGSLKRLEIPDRYELTLSLSKATPIGPINAGVWLQGTGTLSYLIPIAIAGKVIGKLRAEPETLYFDPIPFGQTQKAHGAVIASENQTKLGVLQIETLPMRAREYISARMLGDSTFEVVVSSNAPPGRLSASVRIFLPGDESAIVEVPILGVVVTNSVLVSKTN